MGLAKNPNPLSSFILSKILQNHGRQIFTDSNRHWLLLELLVSHVVCTHFRLASPEVLAPAYTPWCQYEEHVFNHGLRLFILDRGGRSAEFWLAVALKTCLQIVSVDAGLSRYTVELFSDFVSGHFMDIDSIVQHYDSLTKENSLHQEGLADQHRCGNASEGVGAQVGETDKADG